MWERARAWSFLRSEVRQPPAPPFLSPAKRAIRCEVMGVGDGDGQGVGGVRTRDLGAGEQAGDHGMDLRFVCGAGADHPLLDQGGRIFADVNAGACSAHQDDAAGLAQLQRRLCVFVDEDFLDRGAGWRVIGDQRFELVGQGGQAPRQGSGRVGLDLAVGDVTEAVAVRFDQAPAGGAKARIETEDLQASFSSSSSGTS